MTRTFASACAVFIFAGFLAISGCASSAPDGATMPSGGIPSRHAPPAMPDPSPSIEEIVAGIAPDEEQEPRVRSILAAAEEERAEIMSGMRASHEPGMIDDMDAKFEDLDARTENLLASVLTDEQLLRFRRLMEGARTEYKTKMEEMRRRMDGMRGTPPGGSAPGF